MAMSPDQQQQAKDYARVVAKAWQDDAFKQRLLANPRAVLEQEGLDLPAGVEVRLVENTDRLMYLNLPARPEGELSIEQLDQATGGHYPSVYPTVL